MPVTFSIGVRAASHASSAPEPSDLRWLCRRSVCRKNRHDRSGQNRNNPVLHVAPLEPLGIPLMKRDQGDQEGIFEADFLVGKDV